MDKINQKWCDAVNQYANEVIELKQQNAELLAALKAIPPMGEPLQPRHIVMIKQAIAKAEGGE